MKTKQTYIKFLTLLMVKFIGLGYIGLANAETVFYRNISPGAVGSPSYYGIASSEIADDLPFTGSHQVSSFRIGYRSSTPVVANFRFFGVDADTGLPGQFITQITRELPATEFATPTITLDINEQFIFTAEPGLFGKEVTGGWVSMQFESTNGSSLPFDLSAQLAEGPSANGLYNITTGKTMTILDPSGIVPVSFFFEMASVATTGSVIPQVTALKLFPSMVSVGASSTATVNLSAQAPTGGVLVKFITKEKGIYFSSSQVLVKEGNTSAVTTVFTTKRAGPKGKVKQTTAEISAEANGGVAKAILAITK